MRHQITLLLLAAIGRACLGWAPPRPLARASARRFSAAAAAPPSATSPRVVVFTDMDETLIAKKSTGFVIKFLVAKRAWPRLLLLPCLVALLIPLSAILLAVVFAQLVVYMNWMNLLTHSCTHSWP